MKQGEDKMASKHNQEINNLVASLEEKLSRHVVFSKEYLELKNSEGNLVKQQR